MAKKKEYNSIGIISPLFTWGINLIRYLSLVELLKWISACFFSKRKKVFKDKLRGVVIDVFILSKWVFLLTVYWTQYKNLATSILIYYLLFFNLFTYFYYHAWNPTEVKDFNHERRRFLNLFSAFFFNTVGFAYLYGVVYASGAVINPEFTAISGSLLYSVSNAFTGSFTGFVPSSFASQTLSVIQLLMTFIFVGILFSKPEKRSITSNV